MKLSDIQKKAVEILKNYYEPNYRVVFDRECLSIKVYKEENTYKYGITSVLLFEFCLRKGICPETNSVKGKMLSINDDFDIKKTPVYHKL